MLLFESQGFRLLRERGEKRKKLVLDHTTKSLSPRAVVPSTRAASSRPVSRDSFQTLIEATMRAAALGNACGARAASVSSVAALLLPSPPSIVAVRGGVATSRASAPVSFVAFDRSQGARRSVVVSRAVEGGSLSSVSLGPSSSSSSSTPSSASSGGVGGTSKATVVLPLDKVDLTSEVSFFVCVALSFIVIRS